jgi:Fe2+ transport system protein FeoA
MSAESKVSLSKVEAGQTVRLIRVDAGHGLKHRLAAMGLLSNTKIKVLRNEGKGQLVINVKGSKVVLGRGMAEKIMVESAK